MSKYSLKEPFAIKIANTLEGMIQDECQSINDEDNLYRFIAIDQAVMVILHNMYTQLFDDVSRGIERRTKAKVNSKGGLAHGHSA